MCLWVSGVSTGLLSHNVGLFVVIGIYIIERNESVGIRIPFANVVRIRKDTFFIEWNEPYLSRKHLKKIWEYQQTITNNVWLF